MSTQALSAERIGDVACGVRVPFEYDELACCDALGERAHILSVWALERLLGLASDELRLNSDDSALAIVMAGASARLIMPSGALALYEHVVVTELLDAQTINVVGYLTRDDLRALDVESDVEHAILRPIRSLLMREAPYRQAQRRAGVYCPRCLSPDCLYWWEWRRDAQRWRCAACTRDPLINPLL
jgi:hypothetical protein